MIPNKGSEDREGNDDENSDEDGGMEEEDTNMLVSYVIKPNSKLKQNKTNLY
jgi:hypothetical protein